MNYAYPISGRHLPQIWCTSQCKDYMTVMWQVFSGHQLQAKAMWYQSRLVCWPLTVSTWNTCTLWPLVWYSSLWFLDAFLLHHSRSTSHPLYTAWMVQPHSAEDKWYWTLLFQYSNTIKYLHHLLDPRRILKSQYICHHCNTLDHWAKVKKRRLWNGKNTALNLRLYFTGGTASEDGVPAILLQDKLSWWSQIHCRRPPMSGTRISLLFWLQICRMVSAFIFFC